MATVEKQTVKDYSLLPEGSPWQLIEGVLVETPTPSPKHQLILGNIVDKIRQCAKEKGVAIFDPCPEC